MALLVRIDSKKDEKFIAELLGKLGYSTASVDAEELEDITFGRLMKQNSRKDVLTVNEAKAVYKKLPKRK